LGRPMKADAFINTLYTQLMTTWKTPAEVPDAYEKRQLKTFQDVSIPEVRKAMIAKSSAISRVKAIVERYLGYGTIMKIIEPIPSHMARMARQHALRIARDPQSKEGTNLFAPAPTQFRIKISLPGIAGIHVGDLFWIDRIQPNFYLDGVFMTIGLAESISPENGWTTNIEGVFTYMGRFHFAEYFKNTQPQLVNFTDPITP